MTREEKEDELWIKPLARNNRPVTESKMTVTEAFILADET